MKIQRCDVAIGEIAPPAARDQELLAGPLIFFKHQHPPPASGCGHRAEQTGCTGAEDDAFRVSCIHEEDGLIWLIMTIREKIEMNKIKILDIAMQNGAFNVRIFGSVARGLENEESDVDFLVSFKPGVSLFRYAHLINELQDLLGIKVDVASERGLKPHVREKVLASAIPL